MIEALVFMIKNPEGLFFTFSDLKFLGIEKHSNDPKFSDN